MKQLNKAIIRVMNKLGIKGKENREFMMWFATECVEERLNPLKEKK